MGSPGRRVASTLDTALLVFFVLVVLAVGWWILKAVIGIVLVVAQLAILAVLIAVAIRAYLWVRNRGRRKPDIQPF